MGSKEDRMSYFQLNFNTYITIAILILIIISFVFSLLYPHPNGP